ncbi:hypothetical protein Vadar_027686 [Vaccinium darrowii]|uniref:Uncharacterized protein n=1 Tax=Vaccinium darrowii TaxID=229202 RepID=A0ACB7Y3S0_9ERIC|nr:hypothetical protein Vadar_027686 [Vaccinium darrowii]
MGKGLMQKLWIEKTNPHFSCLLKHLIIFLLWLKVSATCSRLWGAPLDPLIVKHADLPAKVTLQATMAHGS